MAFTTCNGDTWKRHDELLKHEMTERMAARQLPIVFGQELGLDQQWLGECSAAKAARGWKVVGASSTKTDKGGWSAGVYIAVNKGVALQKALGQEAWDILPPQCPGRACMALMKAAGGKWVALFSL